MAKIEVRYYTQTGNTKKLAEAIAKELKCGVAPIPSSLPGKVDVLFLGASVYKYGIDAQMKAFIQTLKPEKVGKVVVFSTSALAQRAYPEIKKALDAQGIPVAEENFYCRGKFLAIHKDRPNADDLNSVREFARKVAGV